MCDSVLSVGERIRSKPLPQDTAPGYPHALWWVPVIVMSRVVGEEHLPASVCFSFPYKVIVDVEVVSSASS